MILSSSLKDLFEKNGGVLLTSAAQQAGVSRALLSRYAKNGLIERTAQGVYILAGELNDAMFSMGKRAKKICYSHETALFLHGLTDRTPFQYSVTVPSGYKPSDAIKTACKVYYIRPYLFEMGMSKAKTAMGNLVTAYDTERTICDIIRSRNRIDSQILNEALKRYVASGKPDLNKLQVYASKLGVIKLLQSYLEVLL